MSRQGRESCFCCCTRYYHCVSHRRTHVKIVIFQIFLGNFENLIFSLIFAIMLSIVQNQNTRVNFNANCNSQREHPPNRMLLPTMPILMFEVSINCVTSFTYALPMARTFYVRYRTLLHVECSYQIQKPISVKTRCGQNRGVSTTFFGWIQMFCWSFCYCVLVSNFKDTAASYEYQNNPKRSNRYAHGIFCCRQYVSMTVLVDRIDFTLLVLLSFRLFVYKQTYI